MGTASVAEVQKSLQVLLTTRLLVMDKTKKFVDWNETNDICFRKF